MKRRGSLVVERFAGRLALAFDASRQGFAARPQSLSHTKNLGIIFLLCASRETRTQAHFHLGINAARKTRITPDANLASARLEEIEKIACESIGGWARGERPKVKSAIRPQPPCDIATRIIVPQVHFQNGGRAQAQHVPVARWGMLLRVLVKRKRLLEFRTSDAVVNSRRDRAQIQALRAGLRCTQQPLSSAAQIRGADKVRPRSAGTHFNQ